MANDQLEVDLFVNDAKAAQVLGRFENKLQNTEKTINDAGKNTTFARDFSSHIEQVEGRVSKFQQNLSGAFNVILGGSVAAAFVDVTRASFDAERANRQLSASATQAGLAYQFLNQKAREFADEGGLSQVTANKTEGLIAKLAQASGRPQDLDKLETALLDTASARGIQVSQLETIVNAIVTGSSDEPLNAIGLKDPGALAKDYADKLGKSSDALTKQEQVLSRLIPFLQQAETVTGANAERMASLSGQAETASARLEDLQVRLGKGVTSSLEFRDVLGFANDILRSFSSNIDEVQKKLAQGFTPKQIAEQESDKTGTQILDGFKNFSARQFATIAYPIDVIIDGFNNANEKFLNSVEGAKKRRIESLTELIEGEQKLLEKQNKAAEKQKTFLSLETFEDQEKSRLEGEKKALEERRKEFDKRFSNISGLNDISQNRNLLGSLSQNRDLFTSEEYEKRVYETQQKINQSIEQGKKQVESLEKQYTSLIDSVYSRAGSNNPFVILFSEADKQLKVLRENSKGLSADLISQLEEIETKTASLKLFETRVDNNLAAFDLRERADRFRNAGNPERDKSFFDESVKSEIRRGLFFDGGAFGTYGSNLAISAGADFDKLTAEQKRSIYEVNQLKNLSGNPNFNSVLDGNVNDRSLISRLARERAFGNNDETLSLNQRIEKQLSIIYGGASSDEEKSIADRKFIGLTSSLDPSKVNAGLRDKIISANDREADRKVKSEEDGRKQTERQIKATEDLTKEIVKFNKVAEKEGLSGVKNILEIIDKSNGKVNILGASPIPSDMDNNYK